MNCGNLGGTFSWMMWNTSRSLCSRLHLTAIFQRWQLHLWTQSTSMIQHHSIYNHLIQGWSFPTFLIDWNIFCVQIRACHHFLYRKVRKHCGHIRIFACVLVNACAGFFQQPGSNSRKSYIYIYIHIHSIFINNCDLHYIFICQNQLQACLRTTIIKQGAGQPTCIHFTWDHKLLIDLQ